MLIVLAGTGVLRGMQDTRTPLYVSVGMSTVNGLLGALFALGVGWGIAGSAWGTVLAQTGGGILYAAAVARGARRHGAPLRPDAKGLRASASAGFNLMIRTLSLRVVLVIGTAVAARMGDAQLAAHEIASNVWSLLAFALDAIAIAGQAITGRYLGAGDVTGARTATRRMIEWGVASGVLFSMLVRAARPWLPAIFTADSAVRSQLLAALVVVALLEPIAGVVFVLDGVLIGAGDQAYLALGGVIQTLAFLPAAWAVHVYGGGLEALWLAIGEWKATRGWSPGPHADLRSHAVEQALQAVLEQRVPVERGRPAGGEDREPVRIELGRLVVRALRVTLFVQDEAAHVVAEDEDGTYRVLRVEPGLDQHAQGALDARPAVGRRAVSRRQAGAVPVGQHRPPPDAHALGEPLVP